MKYKISTLSSFPKRLDLQEICLTANITGKFIQTDPTTLDFGNCSYNSVYQLSFHVINNDRIPHGVGVKFPAMLSDCLKCSSNDVYIEAYKTTKLFIKFLPR